MSITDERLTVQTHISRTLAMGADAFNVATRDRIGGSDLALMRKAIVEHTGKCASCGLTVDTGIAAARSVWGHLVPTRYFGGMGGWLPYNVVVMCHTCNHDAGDRLWTADMLSRPDVALIEWPTRAKSKRDPSAESERAAMARLVRNW